MPNVMVVSLTFVLISFVGVFNNELNDEFVKYFDTSVNFMQDIDLTS